MRLVLLLLAALTFAAPRAWGCDPKKEKCQVALLRCGDNPEGHFSTFEEAKSESEKFIREHYHEYEFIVVARVLQIDPVEESSAHHSGATVKITESYKGSLPEIIKLYYPYGKNTCGLHLKPNYHEIFFLKQENDELISFDGRHYAYGLFGFEEISSRQKKELIKNSKTTTYSKNITKKSFLTVSKTNPYAEEKWQQDPEKEEDYIEKILALLKKCKSKRKAKQVKFEINRFHWQNFVNIAFSQPTSVSFFGMTKEINYVYIAYEGKEQRFLDPTIETSDGETYQLEGCPIPEGDSLFEPATPPAP